MKKILTLVALVATTSFSFAQGTFNFANAAATLMSAGGAATPAAATTPFLYAVFFAPSTTVLAPSAAPSFNAAAWQTIGGVASNSATVGRIQTRNGLVESTGTLPAGSTVDFIVRSWSANAGNTWAEALASWNNGSPVNPALAGLGGMFIGSSTIANDLVLGGGPIGVSGLFGVNAFQLNVGFDSAFVAIAPEPSSMAIAGLGAASLLLFRRRK